MKTYTDNYILKLLRQAVLILHDGKCFLCGNDIKQQLDIHHVVKRRNRILRYDYWNSVPVCRSKCHARMDSLEGLEEFKKRHPTKYDYIKYYQNMTLKQYLFEHKMTKKEFYAEKVKALKEIIKGVA